MSVHFPIEKETLVCDLYSQMSTGELAKKFNITTTTVRNILKRNGCKAHPLGWKLNKYSIDQSYFENIDTEEKAYFLGLMGSDGYVSSKGNRVEISLSGLEDRLLLERFKDALKFSGPIKQKTIKYPGAKPHFRLGFGNDKIRQDLIGHGIVPKKSLIYTFNDKIDKNLIRHYVRGYFDGDGSVSFKKDKSFLMSITSSPIFTKKLLDIVATELNLNSHIEKFTKSKASNIKWGGNFVVLLMLDWLYRDATVFLHRKQRKYTLCKGIVSEKLKYPERFYNIYFFKDVMDKAARCAKILDIPFDMSSYNGLSINKEKQEHIIDRYKSGVGVRLLTKELGYSSTVIRNTLLRNGIKMRPSRRPVKTEDIK